MDKMAATVQVAQALVEDAGFPPHGVGIGRDDNGAPVLIVPTNEGIATFTLTQLGDPPPGYTRAIPEGGL